MPVAGSPLPDEERDPLLEVDHIDDHAQGGRDYPAVMIALCANCHSNRTRGADRAN
ncbi:HNH endonuclease signature motif containing protein [Streptomyces sp. JNUCC 63]